MFILLITTYVLMTTQSKTLKNKYHNNFQFLLKI